MSYLQNPSINGVGGMYEYAGSTVWLKANSTTNNWEIV